MEKKDVLCNVRKYVYEQFSSEPTGHDYYHMKRVAHWAKEIALDEGADHYTAELAGWLHDVGDAKLYEDTEAAYRELNDFLTSLEVEEQKRTELLTIIKSVSFSKGQLPASHEGKIVQDADRLDAIGAVGIARTFAFGGLKSQLIYDEYSDSLTSIQHFYDKLLKLSDGMYTRRAQIEAKQRHTFMENYLNQFYSEWNSAERAGEHNDK
ncbi:HD domain-containing protein [Halobacillus sp. B23F22_1]|uniref:HD domain-containing protein n=1 Tax=Halobacillus sp. B23F22_1 TaxID=3459514 RepID=UPI00373F16CB